MARASLTMLAVLALLPATASAGDGFSHRSYPGARFAPGELIVRFRAEANSGARAAALSRTGAGTSSSLGIRGVRLVKLRRGESVRAAAERLERSPQVLYAQPNYRYRLAAVPNDPRFGELWALSNAGQAVRGFAGTPDADVDATDAWSITTGRLSTKVAIVDSGLAYDHPDLAPNLWLNPGESGGGRESNHRDDDRNGFVDDWRGWDFVDRDNDPRDVNGHGTHVAGIAAARGNNGVGTAGVSWKLGLMALRAADADGIVSDAAIVRAFDYAAAQGARVVNASFVSPAFSNVLREAIRQHPKVLFVAAAGNGNDDGVGVDNDDSPQYPCGFSLANLVCVAASDQSDRLTSFSNFGPKTVDLAAPGASVLSAAPAYATLFSSGFETDLTGTWGKGGVNSTWDRTAVVAHSGSFSLSDSPGVDYQDNTDSWVGTAAPVDLGGQHGCRVEYALRLTTESNVDSLVPEVSTDTLTWTPISGPLSGSSQGAFVELIHDITRFDGAGALWLRFHLLTNGSGTADGAQIDDVAVRCLGGSYSGAELVFNDGTSMAAPHVTGAAGLVLSRYKQLGVAAVTRSLFLGADRRTTLSDKLASGGRLNALGSLHQARRLVPKLRVSGLRRQRAGRTGKIAVLAWCSRACKAAGSGSLAIGGASKGLRLRRASRVVGPGGRKRLVLKLTRAALARLRRELARGRRVNAKVTVLATDRLGSTVRATRTIRVNR